MDHFNYKDERLYAENVFLGDIAVKYGTPCYVYSRATLERHWHAFDTAFADCPHKICYSVKANSNIAILNILARLGSGFDIVSGGELQRVLAAGGDPKKVVFSGVGKRADEMAAALDAGIYCFNVESIAELELLNKIAKQSGKLAPVSLRINPDVDAKTHPYIATGMKENKFGISHHDAEAVFKKANSMPYLDVQGIDCHIGSQLTDLTPFLEALQEVITLVDDLKSQGINIKHIDLGGGLGVRYKDETPPLPAQQAQEILKMINSHQLEIILEPGRAIAANAGVLLTEVEYIKSTTHKNFAIVDAAMNDLLRPALYDAWQAIVAVEKSADQEQMYDIVGPVCETADFLGKERLLAIKDGDLLAVRSAGAYGFVMSSNYNSRPRAAEVLVDGHEMHLIRRRETVAELFQHEILLP